MDYKDIEAAVKDIAKQIDKAAKDTLIEAGKFARASALATTKFKVSDTFRSATQFHKLSEYSGFVLADKPYAQYLEYGNNAGGPFIYPRTAKALHFRINGKDIFAKKVRSHPGYYFMDDAGNKLEENIENIFLECLEKYFPGE